MLTHVSHLAALAEAALLERNRVFESFFAAEAERLAEACRQMSERFVRGGRLLAFGRGAYATDAQHVSVEFVHPVIVGKRALPALDLSAAFREALAAMVEPNDMAMGFAAPEGDPEIRWALDEARGRGAMTFALPGADAAYGFTPVTSDPFLHQELMEILYHTLWETVHVFLERRQLGYDTGQSAFLYPFLGNDPQDSSCLITEVASSIRTKVDDDAKLRTQMADTQAETMALTVDAMRERLRRGGKLILFGNGGSATDANDWAIDCVMPPHGYRPIPAISLSQEPAIITAIANDIGTDAIFSRQLIAHGREQDVAIGISTSGGSKNILMAFEEARKRGLLTVALLGCDGGEVTRLGLADHSIVVGSDYIPRIQEVQASVYHTICELLGGSQDPDA